MFGLIGKKIGMTQIFDDTGKLVPVTVIEIHPNIVVAKKTVEKDGYAAVVLGVDEKKKSHVTKPFAGQFPEGIAPTKILREIRDFGKDPAVGENLGAGDRISKKTQHRTQRTIFAVAIGHEAGLIQPQAILLIQQAG